MADETKWTAEGKSLWLSFGEIRQPFLIKGVCYAPTPLGMYGGRDRGRGAWFGDPLGRANEKIWKRDLPLLRAMGANAIRIYGMDSINQTAHDFLDQAWNGGNSPIYVLLSSWIDPGTFDSREKTRRVVSQYRILAEVYGKHPAVMGFSIGGEFNTGDDDRLRQANEAEYWQNFNLVVAGLRGIVGGRKIITTALIDGLRSGGFMDRAVTCAIDAWGFDIYRGKNEFESAWIEYRRHFEDQPPPLLITEFGVPVSVHANGEVREADAATGMGDARDYLATVWNVIQEHGCGGFVFEWTDEWWKQEEALLPPPSPEVEPPFATCDLSLTPGTVPGHENAKCDEWSHDGSREPAKYFNNRWWDEEWFGLYRIAPGDPNVLAARDTVRVFSQSWPELVTLIYPYGDDNGLHYVLFDGSSLTGGIRIPDAQAGPNATFGAMSFGRAACMYRPSGNEPVVVASSFDGSAWTPMAQWMVDASGRIGLTSSMLVAQQTNGHLVWVANSQRARDDIPGASAQDGVAVAEVMDRIYCVHRAERDSRLFLCYWEPAVGWSMDRPLDNMQSRALPAIAAYEDQLFCVFHGLHDDNLWFAVMSGGKWSAEKKLDAVTLKDTPSLAVLRGTIYCFYRGNDDKIRYIRWDRTQKSWETEQKTEFMTKAGPAAAVQLWRPAAAG